MRRGIWVVALVLGLVLGGVAFGQEQEEDGEAAVVQKIWDDVVAQGGFADEKELVAKFVEALRKELGAEHPVTLRMMARIAIKLYEDGDYAGARELGEEVLETLRRVLGPDHLDTLTAKLNLAQISGIKGSSSARGRWKRRSWRPDVGCWVPSIRTP